jgi:hypothetical protein
MIRTGQAFAFPGLAGAITGASPGTPTYPLASLADVSGVLPAGEYNISITSSLGTFAFNTYTVNIAFAEPGQAGACCTGSSCHEAMIAECMGVGMLFGGGGTTCNASGNTTTPCCVADFDHSSLTTVSDVFGFLAAYFAGDSRADVNGGGTSLQDLFDFLQAYLVGGC